MKFLIQTIRGEVKHDFSFALIEACNYNNWYRGSEDFTYELTDFENSKKLSKKGFIPIGSVEFVLAYLKRHYNITPAPINIPEELMTPNFTCRNVFNGTENDIIGEKFVKSNSTIKYFTEICESAPTGNYQISDLIDISSEWRSFIYKGKLVGLQNYSGDFCVFPDVDKINDMIKAYKNQPTAYTLDVAISNKETVIIEVHDFFSCGLYGFSDYKVLPFMFARCFQELIQKKLASEK